MTGICLGSPAIIEHCARERKNVRRMCKMFVGSLEPCITWIFQSNYLSKKTFVPMGLNELCAYSRLTWKFSLF